MESKYAIGIGALALAGVGLYFYLNRSAANADAAPPAPRDSSGAAVNPVTSPNASQGANDAAVIIGALAEFGQRGVDAAMRIREGVQRDTTAAEERQRAAMLVDQQARYYGAQK